MKEPKLQLMLITPSLAKKWLEKNANNRRFDRATMLKWAEAMRQGEWRINGDNIKFAGDFERLLDGQHRLAAIVETNSSIQSYVASGLASECFDTIDQGKKRSVADVMGIRGESSPRVLSAALSVLHTLTTYETWTTIRPSPRTLDNLLNEHPQIRASVEKMPKVKNPLIVPGVAAALHYLFSQRDSGAADAMFHDLLNGLNLDREDGVYWLRERLIQSKGSSVKLRTPYVVALTIKAWNARISGRKVGALKWQPSSEAFPKIEGRNS